MNRWVLTGLPATPWGPISPEGPRSPRAPAGPLLPWGPGRPSDPCAATTRHQAIVTHMQTRLDDVQKADVAVWIGPTFKSQHRKHTTSGNRHKHADTSL